jgi:hypothetical protein
MRGGGEELFYVFNIIVYRMKTAVAVVTRLTKPIQCFLHNLGIHISIYEDDGKVSSHTQEETDVIGHQRVKGTGWQAGTYSGQKLTYTPASEYWSKLDGICGRPAFSCTQQSQARRRRRWRHL